MYQAGGACWEWLWTARQVLCVHVLCLCVLIQGVWSAAELISRASSGAGAGIAAAMDSGRYLECNGFFKQFCISSWFVCVDLPCVSAGVRPCVDTHLVQSVLCFAVRVAGVRPCVDTHLFDFALCDLIVAYFSHLAASSVSSFLCGFCCRAQCRRPPLCGHPFG